MIIKEYFMLSFIKKLFKSEPKATAATTIWAPPTTPTTPAAAPTAPTVTEKQDIVNEKLAKIAKEITAAEQIVEAKVAKIKTRKPRAKKTD